MCINDIKVITYLRRVTDIKSALRTPSKRGSKSGKEVTFLQGTVSPPPMIRIKGKIPRNATKRASRKILTMEESSDNANENNITSVSPVVLDLTDNYKYYPENAEQANLGTNNCFINCARIL